MFILASILGANHTLRNSAVQVIRHVVLIFFLYSLSYVRRCTGCPTIGDWWAGYRMRAGSVSNTTAWMALSTIELRTGIPRLSKRNWFFGCHMCKGADLQKLCRFCASTSSFAVGGVSTLCSSGSRGNIFSLLCVFITLFSARHFPARL